MATKFRMSFNRYFIAACAVWWVVGAAILASWDKIALFQLINLHHNSFLDTLMSAVTVIGQAEVIIPVLLLLFIFKRFRNKYYFLLALGCNIIPFLVQQGLKSFFDYDRPLAYLGTDPERVHLLADWPQLFHRSFPSGHTAGAFSFFCFLAMLLPPRYSRYGLLFFVPAILVGYSRVYLGAHFAGDVYFGSLAGTLTTIVVFSVFKSFGRNFNFETE